MQQHQKARPNPNSTTTYVFNEIVTFLKRRISHDKAAHIGDALISSSIVELIHKLDL